MLYESQFGRCSGSKFFEFGCSFIQVRTDSWSQLFFREVTSKYIFDEEYSFEVTPLDGDIKLRLVGFYIIIYREYMNLLYMGVWKVGIYMNIECRYTELLGAGEFLLKISVGKVCVNVEGVIFVINKRIVAT